MAPNSNKATTGGKVWDIWHITELGVSRKRERYGKNLGGVVERGMIVCAVEICTCGRSMVIEEMKVDVSRYLVGWRLEL